MVGRRSPEASLSHPTHPSSNSLAFRHELATHASFTPPDFWRIRLPLWYHGFLRPPRYALNEDCPIRFP